MIMILKNWRLHNICGVLYIDPGAGRNEIFGTRTFALNQTITFFLFPFLSDERPHPSTCDSVCEICDHTPVCEIAPDHGTLFVESRLFFLVMPQ